MERVARSTAFSRQVLIASGVFGLFVLLNIALFGWLIFRSLSQREVDRVLFETRAQAQTLAGRIARRAASEGKDLYTAVAVEKETQTFIDQMLSQRDVVSTLTIHDKSGNLVFQGRQEAHVPTAPQPTVPPVPGSPELQQRIVTPRVEPRVEQTVRTTEFQVPDIQVPIGDYGSLQIGISASQLQKRIEVLRRDLIRQTTLTAIVSMSLLVSAFVAVWVLLRRAQRLELQTAEAERLAYIGTLASGLAHEIRNPLNSLNLNMQMLEEEIDENGSAHSAPTGKRLLSITRSEISRLERLVTDFLAYAKPRALELEEMPAVRLLERLREVLAGEIQKRRAQMEVDDRSGGARVRVDPGQMKQLLFNLAQNAFSAAEEAGPPPVRQPPAWRQGPAVCLEMADNGIGMTSEEQAKIFDLFYSNRKGGTGLGLAIVDRIVRAHGGRVGVRSAKGVGTTVIVELPAVAPSEPHRAAVEAPVGA